MVRRKRKEQSNSVRALITKVDPKSPISEQYRTIRTNLQFASIDRQLRNIMVTSTSPAEGKSTTIANLAVVLAQQGNRVLLVDADLRKPTVHYTFRCPNTKGLTSVLTKQAQLEDAIMLTDVENLDILTSGPVPPNPSELLSSKSMELLLTSTTVPYDIILLDTPPVLVVTDAQLLANICDGVVLVVSSGKTEIEQAIKAKELLEMSKAKILGAVLNNKDVKHSQNYYYYGKN
ncbi:CpsD/CapB family tyrosine-protein kinase [Anaerobacillus sp. CMMVII]|uniref:CpsD/CapB family tyrosine-protein kinase n=1 Tax=Anaerobacillus sp. CMMVII TaxID=2755588 RepID=UPI0021B70CAB|nr:CpsD/CapB family tyrosine-protein kinase [Anaerobacillus sp. CMMVII]MCT8140340.1 CpsD/CapB family tyrosine-protein kinase [Anaerobacillus sp. CMMVII]